MIIDPNRKDITESTMKILNHIERILISVASNETEIPKEYFETRLHAAFVILDLKNNSTFNLTFDDKYKISNKYGDLIHIMPNEAGGSVTVFVAVYIKEIGTIPKEFIQTISMTDKEFELWFKLEYGI